MSCENRLGKLEIPNGLAGPPGTPGVNGAGWQSGSGVPRGTPPADILFYLNVDSGQLFKWNGTAWISIVNSIYGTDGNVWLTGTLAPTTPTANGNFYYRTTTGEIFQYNGVSWGSPIANIQGQNGAPGINGTGLLAANSNIASQVFSTAGPNNINLNCTLSFNAQQAFPTLNSVVKSTLFVKSAYNNTSATTRAPSTGQIYFVPRIVNDVTVGFADLDVVSIDKNTTLDDKVLFPPSVINNNYLHGRTSSGDYSVSNSGLPNEGTTPSKQFPFAYTKIVSTFIRNSASSVIATVEYTTTTRYGTYTAIYQPSVLSLTLGFGPSDGISIEQLGTVIVPANYPIAVYPVYHIIEKSIL